MGSCVSKKAARAGAKGKVSAPLPVVEKENAHALPPVLEVEAAEAEEEEEVKEVVLSETPVPRPPPKPIKRRQEQPDADDGAAASETCSANDSAASVASAAKEEEKAKVHEVGAGREVDAPVKGKTAARRTAPEERERESSKSKGGGVGGVSGHGRSRSRSRSPSPLPAHRRQHSGGQGQQHQHHHHPPAARPRREQPAVVSGIGCRSGRFSPSATRRAAESAVRRTHSAREADMALPSSKRSLSLNCNGNRGGSALSRRDPGERSGRRPDSPTGRHAAAPPGAIHRPVSPVRKAAPAAPERARPAPPRVRDCGSGAALLGGREQEKLAGGEDGALAMECFIFL